MPCLWLPTRQVYRFMQIVIVGPTGVGKTAVGEALACKLEGQIVNADLGQMYRPLTIGTAKPAWQQSDIKQHMFDIITEPVNLDAQSYRQMVAEIVDREQVQPLIFVGGSGFYVHTLFFRLADSGKIESDDAQDESWEALCQVDPERAAQINPGDTYRIRRALAIWRTTGVLPSSCAPVYDAVLPRPILINLVRERSVLVARLEQRFRQMIECGWIEEVAALEARWQDFCLYKKIIGYNELVMYVRGQCTFEQAQEQIVIRTRQYAKRQMSYFRMLERSLKKAGVPVLTLQLDAHTNDQVVDLIMQST